MRMPVVGEGVHYVPAANAEPVPAVVTRIHSPNVVNLFIMDDTQNHGVFKTSVVHDEDMDPFTWHYADEMM